MFLPFLKLYNNEMSTWVLSQALEAFLNGEGGRAKYLLEEVYSLNFVIYDVYLYVKPN